MLPEAHFIIIFADRSKYESEQAQLALKVKQIFDDSEQRYGAEKIRTILISNGLHVSKKHISAIMQELGLHSVRTDAKKLYKAQQRKKQDLLNRRSGYNGQIYTTRIC